MILRELKWDHPDFRKLVTLLDAEFRERYGAAQEGDF
jgi:hypothetical protein